MTDQPTEAPPEPAVRGLRVEKIAEGDARTGVLADDAYGRQVRDVLQRLERALARPGPISRGAV